MIALYLSGQRPHFILSVVEGLPHTFACSTIGPAGLNLRRFRGPFDNSLRSFAQGRLRGEPRAEILSAGDGSALCRQDSPAFAQTAKGWASPPKQSAPSPAFLTKDTFVQT